MATPGHELPQGWTEHSLGSKTFYYHKASNTTQEERPAPPPVAEDASPSASQALRAAAAPSAPPEAALPATAHVSAHAATHAAHARAAHAAHVAAHAAHAPAKPGPGQVVWLSLDPRSGVVNVYSPEVTARLEGAHRQRLGDDSAPREVPLAGLGPPAGPLEAARVDLGDRGQHFQQNPVTKGCRDVRRVEVPADAAEVCIHVVHNSSWHWRIVDTPQAGVTEERRAALRPGGAGGARFDQAPVIATPVAAPAATMPMSFASQAVAAQPVSVVHPASPEAASMPAPTAHVALLRVFVPPPGLEAGQQLAFAAPPSGGRPAQPMTVTASQAVAAGSVLTVQYPVAEGAPSSPALPQPQVDMTDERAARNGWILFASGWGCLLCCGNILGVLLWVVSAGLYFCRPREQRALRARQRKAAVAACWATSGVAGLALLGLLLVGSHSLDFHPHHPHGHHHHYRPTEPPLVPTHFDPPLGLAADGAPPPIHSLALGESPPGPEDLAGGGHHGHHHGHNHTGGHHHGCNHTGEHDPGRHHEREQEHRHGFFSSLRGRWHQLRHPEHEEGARQEKPCRFHAFLRRFFGSEEDGDAAPEAPAGPLPSLAEGQMPLRQTM